MGGHLLAASHVAATPDISIGHLLLQMLVAMVIIVGGIWGFSKLAGRSRAAGRRAGRRAGGLLRQRSVEQGLTILSRQPLGKGKCLAVVQVGVQQFLVGIADSGLTPLGELRSSDTAPDALTAGALAAAPLADGNFFARQVAPGATAFGADDLSAIDLQALGVRAATPEEALAGSVRAPRAVSQSAAPAVSQSAAPAVSQSVSQSAAPAVSQSVSQSAAPPMSRSVRAWVDALREATVRH